MREILKNGLSHAYIIEGDKGKIIPELFSFLEKQYTISVRGNPDFWHKEYDSFGIEDGHSLRAMQTRKGVEGGKKFFVFSFSSITEEAQNALLKVFEEPTEGTHFFVVTPSLSQIFPTLLSRAVVISSAKVQTSYDTSYEKIAEQFLTVSPAQRLGLIKNLIEEKNREHATLFLNAIEKKIASDFKPEELDLRAVAQLKKTARARRDLLTTTPSIKLIFEYLALTL